MKKILKISFIVVGIVICCIEDYKSLSYTAKRWCKQENERRKTNL